VTLLPNASFKLRQLLDANKDHPIASSLESWITESLQRDIDDITSFSIDRQERQWANYNTRYVVNVVFEGDDRKYCEVLFTLE
jgi:hypothetical protein